ncbi:amino acid:proton symporter, partial [Paraburkholderia diazotrophica]
NQDLKAAWWLVAYLPGMAILSLIGSKQFGGMGVLPYGWDMLVVIVFSLVFYYWGVHTGYRSTYLDERDTILANEAEYATSGLSEEEWMSAR